MTVRRTISDDWALPGLEVSHDLGCVLGDWDAWLDVESSLKALGGHVHALNMRRQREGVLVRCRVKGVSAREMREVARWLTEEKRADSVSVEHLMLVRTEAG